jgi:hypothetical protein
MFSGSFSTVAGITAFDAERRLLLRFPDEPMMQFAAKKLVDFCVCDQSETSALPQSFCANRMANLPRAKFEFVKSL